MKPPIHLAEFEERARQVLPQMVYDYYAGGSHDEITLGENRTAFERIRMRYRVLRDVSTRRLGSDLLGQSLSMPVVIAPTAFQQLAHEEGELATARAAAEAGTIMTLSSLSTRSIEDVGEAAAGRLWFQLYLFRDRKVTMDLVQRAEAANAKALVLTVDAPYLGVRERDVRNGFRLPPGLHMANLTGRSSGFPEVEGSGLAAYFAEALDPSLNWSDLEWLCGVTRLPVVVKGVVRGDDAAMAVESGAAGVVVSNHGGRQLDTSPPTIEVLPEVVEAVAGRGTILVDGGVRRGTDVLKALALGAQAVLIGRPVLWGLAVDGEAGVSRVLALLRAEIDLAMALCGVRGVDEVGRDLVGT